MDTTTTTSVLGTTIRLTEERYLHIVRNHPELKGKKQQILQTITRPEQVVEGKNGEYIALRKETSKYFVVVYREDQQDGFVITAFITSKPETLTKRKIIWLK